MFDFKVENHRDITINVIKSQNNSLEVNRFNLGEAWVFCPEYKLL